MRFQLVLFDCDGTLVDSEHLNLKAIIELIESFGITGYDIAHGLLHFSGYRFSHIMQMVSNDTGFTFPADLSQRYLEKVRLLAATDMQAIDGAYDMVKCAAKYCKVSVVSNGERRNVFASLEFANLKQFFEEENVITGLMAPNPKPAPDLYLEAAKRQNTLPQNCLVIEDSIAGVIAAKDAGMEVWGITATHPDKESHAKKLLENGAKFVFKDMHDIKERFTSFQEQSKSKITQ